MYTGQVTVSQSKLPGFLKTAQSLKVRGLAEQYKEDLPTNPDSCFPPRKRRRNLSADGNQPPVNSDSKDQVRSSEGPTDLSLPKLEPDVCFQPVIQAVSYSATNPCNASYSNKIYLKPKEGIVMLQYYPKQKMMKSPQLQYNHLSQVVKMGLG